MSPPRAISVPALRSWMSRTLAVHAGTEPAVISTSAPFTDFGVDSVFVLGWCTDLEDAFGIEVDPALVWEHPSIEALARYLAGAA